MKQPENCKYTPFEAYLRKLAETKQEVILTFEQIDRTMPSPLPKSARTRLNWWDNEVHSGLSHKNAWLNAGWKVDSVDLEKERVRFVRS